jgi:CrcB protein
MNLVFIFIGSGIGAVFRYFTTQVVNNLYSGKFLFGTVVVNCIGALIIGFIINLFDMYSINLRWKLFLVTGFLGGYTTFSAYSFETVNYMLNGNIKYAIMNIILSNVICVAFVFFGIWLNKIIFTK